MNHMIVFLKFNSEKGKYTFMNLSVSVLVLVKKI